MYTMNDNIYRDFMYGVLTNLEPRYEQNGFYLVKELDSFEEITFISQGKVGLGFEVNKNKKII